MLSVSRSGSVTRIAATPVVGRRSAAEVFETDRARHLMIQARLVHWLSVFAAVILLALFLHAVDHPYQYFRAGNPNDVQTKAQAGFALMGGGDDLDEAFRWMCERAGGGDFVVLRASGDEDYNPYIQGLCKLNSVATIILKSREAAKDPFVAEAIRHAEAVFIAGGDQAHYIN